MGLDQSLLLVKTEELHYWRKHPAIHDWFEKEWRKLGGEGDFNCVPLRLNAQMVVRLLEDIKNNNLNYEASGFFFGSSARPDGLGFNEQKKADIEIFEKVLALIQDGNHVEYDSWW